MIDPHSYDSCKMIFAEYNIQLTETQYQKFSIYAEMLLEESKHQNVTAVRELPDIWIRHFVDSAYLLRFIPEKVRLLDMGTGGGIPGIPLAIMQPNLQITMLDSELKKISFCQRVIQKLSLNASAISGRAEELAHDPEFRSQYHVIVSRAMANGSVLTELSVPFLRQDGFLLAMKGKQYDPEFERFEQAASVLGASVVFAEPYTICGEEKYLIRVQKTTDTPERFPRRFAKIKRSPL